MTAKGALDHSNRLALVLVLVAGGCATEQLSSHGTLVRADLSPPSAQGFAPSQCRPLGTVVGKGGGSFGGAWISNEQLVEYALNDIRNKAASLGANYVHYAAPQFGTSGGRESSNVSSCMITGTAFLCSGEPAGPVVAAAPAAAAPAAPTSPPAASTGVRRSKMKDGSRALTLELVFPELKVQLAFTTSRLDTVYWEVIGARGLTADCKPVIVVDGNPATYTFGPSEKRRLYFTLPLGELERLAAAERVTGRVCDLDWRWSGEHAAAVKELVLQIKEELAILGAAAQ